MFVTKDTSRMSQDYQYHNKNVHKEGDSSHYNAMTQLPRHSEHKHRRDDGTNVHDSKLLDM